MIPSISFTVSKFYRLQLICRTLGSQAGPESRATSNSNFVTFVVAPAKYRIPDRSLHEANMILSHSHKFIFVHLYKTGGTSVRRCLEKYDAAYKIHHRAKSKLTSKPVFNSPVADKHATAATIRETVGADLYDRYFSFCFVRNPWAWQVSLYHYILKTPGHAQHRQFNAFEKFDDYIAWRCDENVQLQKDYLVDKQDQQIVSFIGRMENIQQDFKTVCEKVGLESLSLPHLNQSVAQSQRKSYQAFYNPQTQSMVAESFKADIDFLGYKF